MSKKEALNLTADVELVAVELEYLDSDGTTKKTLVFRSDDGLVFRAHGYPDTRSVDTLLKRLPTRWRMKLVPLDDETRQV